MTAPLNLTEVIASRAGADARDSSRGFPSYRRPHCRFLNTLCFFRRRHGGEPEYCGSAAGGCPQYGQERIACRLCNDPDDPSDDARA